MRYIEYRFSPNFIFFCFFNAVWALTSGGFRIVSDTLVLMFAIKPWAFGYRGGCLTISRRCTPRYTTSLQIDSARR